MGEPEVGKGLGKSAQSQQRWVSAPLPTKGTGKFAPRPQVVPHSAPRPTQLRPTAPPTPPPAPAPPGRRPAASNAAAYWKRDPVPTTSDGGRDTNEQGASFKVWNEIRAFRQ